MASPTRKRTRSKANGQADAPAPQQPQGFEVNAEVVARRLQLRLAERTAEHEWELAIRDARIADLEAELVSLREALDEAADEQEDADANA